MDKTKLTEQQRAVVEDRGGPLLVSAAAGSGKTSVLVGRLAEYITDARDPRRIDDFLIITYTKAAAAELRVKIASELQSLLAADPGSAHLRRQPQLLYLTQISTVHAFCAAILRQYAWRVDLTPDFGIAEERDCEVRKAEILETVLEESYEEMSPDFARLADSLGAGRDDSALETLVLKVFETLQTHPDPDARLRELRDSLTTEGAASETIWCRAQCEDLTAALGDWIEPAAEAVDLAGTTETLRQKVRPALESELDSLIGLREASAGGREAVYRYLTAPETGELFVPRLTFPRTLTEDEMVLRDRIKGLRDLYKTHVRDLTAPFLVPDGEVLADLTLTAPAIRALLDLTERFSRAWAAEKRRRNVLDFSDLEHTALKLLAPKGVPSETAAEISDRFREVLVDEYQDTNRVQDAIFSAVSHAGRNLFMVGDVKQSIYRFRQADPSLFLERYASFVPVAEAEEGEPRKILLSRNFRSRPEVLEACNHVFSTVMSQRIGGLDYGEEEALRFGAAYYPEASIPVELHVLDLPARRSGSEGGEDEETAGREEQEAALVARRIRELLEEPFLVTEGSARRPVRPGDIAILLRSPSSRASAYLEALRAEGIPASSDRGSSIVSTPEVSLLLSLLRVVDNPRQDIPLAAALAGPLFGFGAEDLARLRVNAPEACLYDALAAAEDTDDRAAAFLALLRDLREKTAVFSVGRMVWEVIRRTRMEDILSAGPEGSEVTANLETVFRMACSFDAAGGTFGEFADHVLTQSDSLRRSGEGAEAVSLVSIHSSKGLEYPVVVLADLGGKINQKDSSGLLLTHPELGIGADAVDPVLGARWPTAASLAIAGRLRIETLSEEQRILYVAMTRAKEKLIMTCCRSGIQKTLKDLAALSRFPASPALVGSVTHMGDWILAAALLRPESQVLKAFFDLPDTPVIGVEMSWDIRVHTRAPEPRDAAEPVTGAILPGTDFDPEEILGALRFAYDHPGTRTPAKATATGLKGRQEDLEAAEHTAMDREISFPTPSFARRELTAAQRGTAVHLVMQYADYAALSRRETAAEEICRLAQEGYLTEQQAEAVTPGRFLRFFASPLGRRVLACPDLIREFKFSVLVDAAPYFPEAAGEELLLQGMVDCCIPGPEGLTILDFKTDAIHPGEEAARAETYRAQMTAYADALSRIFERPVTETILYFFRTDTAFSLK